MRLSHSFYVKNVTDFFALNVLALLAAFLQEKK